MAAAAAVGKVMKLDVPTMRNAIGLAASQVIGLQSQLGSHAKSFHPGRAAQCGLLASVLASKGLTSSAHALEAHNGWLHAVTPRHDFPSRVQHLGKDWEIVENAFKPYACGIVCHPLIDGCVQLHHELEQIGAKLSEVRSVDAIVNPLAVKVTGERQPETGLQGKFSVYHSGAVALVFGKAGILQYTDAVVQDPQVKDSREKIHPTTDANLARDEAVLTLTLNDGRVLKKHVVHAVGSIDVPMTDEQLTEKFKDQAILVLNEEQLVDRASEACWKLDQVADMTEIIKFL
jgi:aconitate decarboxylase